MKKHIYYFLFLAVVLAFGCQKETSFEGSSTPAEGSLQAELTGDCLPKTVNGAYVAGTALVPANNTIAVQVNVARTGSYEVYTDTVNGYFFRATGTFTTLGLNTVTLRSSGTPFAAGVNNFVVNFDSTVCDIQVTVLPAGSGPATFTLVSGGTPVNCASAAVTGTYVKDAALAAVSHYVDVTVNVTATGIYTIKATGGGMTFQKTGTFAATGNATVRLDGSGTPTVAGPNTVTFDAPFTSCNFTVTVVAPITGTLGGAGGVCTPITPTGTYTQGTVPPPGNTVQVQITTSGVGPYSVTTNTIGGLSFSASGTSTGGTQMITLLNNGVAPTVSGNQTFTATFGTSQCNFNITIVPTGTQFQIDCANAVVNGTYTVGVPLTAANFIDLAVLVSSPGPYNITASINGMTFSGSGNMTLATTSVILAGNTSTSPTGPAGTYNLPVGNPVCLIPIQVVAAPTIDWKFTIGATTYQGGTDQVFFDNTSFPPFTIVDYYGNNAALDEVNITLGDPAGSIFSAGETYHTNVITVMNAGYFYFFGSGLELEATEPGTTPGVNIIYTVSSHNTVTKVIVGTFAGTAFDYVSSTNKTITGGTFTIRY